MNAGPFITALLLSLLLTPVSIVFARRVQLVDVPDGTTLKIHDCPVANAGGLVVAFAVLPLVLMRGWELGIYVVGPGAFFALTLGLVDDFKGTKPPARLFAQSAIGLMAVVGGLRTEFFPSIALDGALSMCAVMGAMNAFNLLDGMDGLASGVGAICCAAFAAFFYVQDDVQVFILASTLLAAFLGFLPYNFHPAHIFLGNSGSSLSGFLLAVLLVLSLRNEPTLAGCAGSLLIVGLPLADTAFAIVRRLRSGRGIMVGDREHFYDKLLRRGFSQRQSALIGYTAAASCASCGLAILLAWR